MCQEKKGTRYDDFGLCFGANDCACTPSSSPQARRAGHIGKSFFNRENLQCTDNTMNPEVFEADKQENNTFRDIQGRCFPNIGWESFENGTFYSIPINTVYR